MKQPSFASPQYKLVVFLLVLFLLIIPKGGFKLADTPITWGYMMIGLTALAAIPTQLFRRELGAYSREKWIVVFALLPFQVICVGALLSFGYTKGVGVPISLLTTMIALPWIFIVILSPCIERMDHGYLHTWIRRGVFGVALYGLVDFTWTAITGHHIEIAYVTVNSADFGHLADKYNARGDYSKLISTYSNGNIFGVCMLLLLPLYRYIETSKLRLLTVKAAIILTLSRTAWAGLFAYQLCDLIYINGPSLHRLLQHGRIDQAFLFKAAKTVLGIALLVGSLAVLLGFIGQSFTVFDSTLGGRVVWLDTLKNITLFPSRPFGFIPEMVYLGVMDYFGLVGLLAFLCAIATPVFLAFTGRVSCARSKYKKSLTTGLFLYVLVAMIDGAFMLIPVMALYWCLVALLLAKKVNIRSVLLS